MIRIALAEDNEQTRRKLADYLETYERERREPLQVSLFQDGMDLLEDSQDVYDIIFLDIEMQHMDGITTAERIRQRDKKVILIFITNLAQYAIKGYAVEAMDYLLKPVSYFAFSQELDKAISRARQMAERYVTLLQESGMVRLTVSQITYIESQGHNIIYHTTRGEFCVRDSLKNVEKRLVDCGFSRCNNCYLVNLRHVERVDKYIAVVGGCELTISRPRRKGFMEELAEYFGSL